MSDAGRLCNKNVVDGGGGPVKLMKMRRVILIVLLAASAISADAAVLREAEGLVQVRPEGSDRWQPAGKLPRTLASGDSLRTGFRARAAVALAAGGLLETGGNTQVSIDEAPRGGVVVTLLFGTARLSVRALGARLFELRAPTATAQARSASAAWRTTVGGGGSAVFEAEEGLLGLEDSRGGALRLGAGERAEADLAGLHEPTIVPAPERARRDDFAERMRRELTLDSEIDAAQRLVADEARREEYELGHVLTDASGGLVRAEQYVVRLSPTSFEFVALNGSRGGGLSWYSWTGVFDLPLPRNLAPVFAVLPGSAGAPAPWTLTGYTSVISNGIDSLVASASGGHQVNVNGSADPTEAVSVLYDPATDGFANVAGQAVYQVLFDRYGLYSDGALKYGWTGTNLQSYADRIPATTNDPLTGAALSSPLPGVTTNTTFPDAGSVTQTVLSSYSDGTSISVTNSAVPFGGGVATRASFGGATSGSAWQSGLLQSTLQQSATATEFGGRSIRVLLSPRILVETGGLP
jgi:hypothetical protein